MLYFGQRKRPIINKSLEKKGKTLHLQTKNNTNKKQED